MPNVAIDSDDATINAVNFTQQVSDPPNPASGHGLIYLKSGKWYSKIGSTVAELGGGMINPMNAEGQMIVGGYLGAPMQLTTGNPGDVLTLGAVNPDWAPPAAGTTLYTSAWASPPAGPATGALWAPSDGYLLYHYDGAAWVPVAWLSLTKTPPVVSAWTWVNQGTATAVDDKGTILLTSPNETSWQWRMLTKTLPDPPYVITACLSSSSFPLGATNSSIGIGWRQNAAGGTQNYLDMLLMLVTHDNTCLTLYRSKFTGPSTGLSNYASSTYPNLDLGRLWLRLADDNSDRICSVSNNGIDWRVFHTITRTDWLTPDQAVFGVSGGSIVRTVRLISWREA